MSHLHARHKTRSLHEDSERSENDALFLQPSPPSGGFLKGKAPKLLRTSRRHFRRKFQKFLSRNELCWAVAAVTGFLAFGLLLGDFLLHHQHRRVVLHVMRHPWAHGKAAMTKGRVGFHHHFYSGSPRFVAIVMPSLVNPGGRTARLESIQDTWGPYARAIYVVHNVTAEFPKASHAVISETSHPEDPYAYPQLLAVPPDISVEDGLNRLYYVIRVVYEKVNPDFAYFVNDHTFVIPEHLCKYLEQYKPSEDLYAGHGLLNSDKEVFNSGAAGYLLSRLTMKKLVQEWDEKDPTCWLTPQSAGKWLQDNPGLVTNRCLRSLNVLALDTRARNKWHRFHAFPLTRLVSGKIDAWYQEKHKGIAARSGFSESYETLLSGDDCCSRDTISFHYVEKIESRALFACRQALLEDPYMTDRELKNMMITEWPKTKKEVGEYSSLLPEGTNNAAWEPLLHVMRKISTRKTQRDC